MLHHNPPQPQIIATRRKPTARKTLLAGANVRKGQYAPPPPTKYWLDVGKLISLELTLAEYGIAPNAATVRRLDGER